MTITCSNCDCPFDPGEDRTVVACPFCGHRTFNPFVALGGEDERDDDPAAARTQRGADTLYQLTEGRATYGLVVRDGVVVECAPYGRKRWLGKTERELIAAGAVLARTQRGAGAE